MKKFTRSFVAILLAVTVVLFSAMSAFAISSCTNCGRIFESSSAYNMHVKFCGAGKSTDAITFYCSYCGAVFQTKALLSAHIDSCVAKPAVSQKGNVNTCPHCLTDFADENEYNNHVQLCQTTYPCSICSKEFKTSTVLNLHKVACVFVPSEVKVELSIANNPGSTEIKYGESLILTAETKNLPSGAYVKWTADGSAVEIEQTADGKTCKVKSVDDGTVTVMARVVDKDGNAVKDLTGKEIYDTEVIISKAGFFQKIASFFKNLFKMNRTTTQTL